MIIEKSAVESADVEEGSTVEACAVRGQGGAQKFDRPVVLRVVGIADGATRKLQ